MATMKFTNLTPTEFTTFERHAKTGNFFQSTQRAELRRKMGFTTHLVGVKNGKKVTAAALIIERDHEALLQLGPVMDYNDLELLDFFLTEVTNYSLAQKFIRLEIFPPVVYASHRMDGSIIDKPATDEIFTLFSHHGFTHEGFTVEVENKANRWMFIKDLSGLTTLRDAELTMNASTRKKLHKTSRELYIHVLTDKSELPAWREALVESNRRNGIPTRDIKYFEDLWDAFGDDAVFVEARVKATGELVSSEVDIFHPNEMVAFVAGTIESRKHYNGSTAIKGWNIEECLRRGQTRMNLYGMRGDFSPSNPLLFFKSGLGGYTEEYIGGFCRVFSRPRLIKNQIKRRLKSAKIIR